MIHWVVTAALAAGAMSASGYLLGARRGVRARDALRDELSQRAEAAERARAEREKTAALLDRANAEVTVAQRESDELRAALTRATDALARPRERAVPAPAPLDEVRRMLAPLLDKARLDESLTAIAGAETTRGELPRLLDAIARRGGFDVVVLSDDSGLPVAASAAADRAEPLAAVASMVLTMADRVTASGSPEPRAVLVHDAEHRTLVHRVLRARGERFLLTAVGHGTALGVDALDPAVSRIERLLAS